MTKRLESGKSRLIKGSLLYAWEELKTMNMVKFRALGRILSGYLRMKFADKKPVSDARNSDFSLNGR
jgi:hypothetical protein